MLPEPLIPFRRPLIVAGHLLLIPAGYLLAFWLRFDFSVPAAQWSVFLATVPILVAVRFGSFALFGLFRGWWRHVGLRDLVDLVQATTASTLVFVLILFLTGQGEGIARSVLVLDWAVAILLFGGARAAVRTLREGGVGFGRIRGGTPALVVGGGAAGERLVRQLLQETPVEIRPVGIVDDDPAKARMRLHGVPVVGTARDIPRLVAETGVKLVVIAIPSASRQGLQRIVERCMESGVDLRIIPSLREMLEGGARLRELRKVEVEDLLGRAPVELDLAAVESDLEDRVVMVTGGAGSIGSELARQIAAFGPRKLVVLDQAESPLYFVDLELRGRHPDLEIVPIVADVTDRGRMGEIFSRHRPDHVYHAAAYKHVPLMEDNVVEAVRNNVLGTLRVAEAAAVHGAEKFLLVSTDKAVNPSSVMGATKRVAERVVLGSPSLRRSRTDFRAVRFGNVLGSEGSVIPLFRRQLEAGGPLTVTHRDVTRYFMTIPEAVQLVLQAGALPEAAGRISMLDMGEPVRIVELAENLIRLSGMEPYTEMPIVFTGLRPGEKLFEELMSEVEETVPTGVEKIRVVQTDEPDLNAVRAGVQALEGEVATGDRDLLVTHICDLVPEHVEPLRSQAARIAAERAARAAAGSGPGGAYAG